MLNPLLKRQLKKVGLHEASLPDAEQWSRFLEHVDRKYKEAEQDRYLLERSLAISSAEMQELYERLAVEKRVLEMIARGSSLDEVMEALVLGVEAQSDSALCSILLVDEENGCLRHGAAPSLPDGYNERVDGIPIGPAVGSCGTAAYRNEPVVVTDIASDPLWEGAAEIALEHGLRACWSTPIPAADGRVLGTFAMYYREPRSPSASDLRLIESATHTAGIAIERKRAEEALREREATLRATLESTEDGILVVNGGGRVCHANDRFARMWRIPRDILETKDDKRLLDFVIDQLEDPQAFLSKVEELYGTSREDFDTVRFKDGRIFERFSRPLVSADDRKGRVWSFRDVTVRRQAEETIRHLAFHDPLTNLPNRTLLKDRLTMELARSRRDGGIMAVMFLDLDRFKVINDTLGHTAGDELLRKIGERLKLTMREADTVARVGGDEFALVTPGLEGVDDARDIARRVIEKVREPVTVYGEDLHITTSIGVVIHHPHDNGSAETILRNADTAMYRAKEQGRDCFELYTSAMGAHAAARLRLERELRLALDRREFEVHYQPQVSIATGQITGVEALVRWRHPAGRLLLPGEFIALAEETGLIVRMGHQVLEMACEQMRAWRKGGLPPLSLAVNLSARQFQQPDLAEMIAGIIEEYDLDPGALQIELTEGTAMQNAGFTLATLHQLRDLGVQIALDDFGTGYSALSYLKQFPINSLKIDRSFVGDLTRDRSDAAIATAVIVMAHNLGLSVIAEGVETEDQLTFLAESGCDYYQGFLFSRPVPAEQIEQMLKGSARATPVQP